MFINENNHTINNNKYLNEAVAEPYYVYEAILEANEAYHDLCMKMIKCEHTAIINENNYLLEEAEEEFKIHKDNIFRKLVERFQAFCAKIYDTMLEAFGTAVKFLNTGSAKNVVGKSIKGTIGMREYDIFIKDYASILNTIKNGNIKDVYNKKGLALVKQTYQEQEFNLKAEHYDKAENYIKNFKPALTAVRAMRSENFSNLSRDQKLASEGFQLLTKIISRLKDGLFFSIKIIRLGSNRVANKANKLNKTTTQEGIVNGTSSVLDIFG